MDVIVLIGIGFALGAITAWNILPQPGFIKKAYDNSLGYLTKKQSS